MFLLDMPNKKEKVPAYKQRLNAKLKDIPNSAKLDSIKEENSKILTKFQESVENLST